MTVMETAAFREFYGSPRASLEDFLRGLGLKPVHARELFRAAYKELASSPWRVKAGLPTSLAPALAAAYRVSLPKSVEEHESRYDGSRKFLFELEDGARVESVLMPETSRLTLCLSTQVGCRQGCVFCHTGRMGLIRNLTAGEIVGQVVAANRFLAENPAWLRNVRLPESMRVTNVVFMGMGEPLDNVASVVRAIRIMTDPYGLALGLRRISVSTAGHLEGIETLLAKLPGVRLALSVHHPDDAKRSRIMPINRRFPLATVFARLKELWPEKGPALLLQYTLIDSVNDDLGSATKLADLAEGLPIKVNLIPLNPVEPSRLKAPSPERIQEFRDVLHARGIRTMIRYSKGQDIAAACGQLVVGR